MQFETYDMHSELLYTMIVLYIIGWCQNNKNSPAMTHTSFQVVCIMHYLITMGEDNWCIVNEFLYIV